MPKHNGNSPTTVSWKVEPDAHDYPAAASYLALVADAAVVAATVRAFESAVTSHFKAKDILRASGLPLLKPTNPHVSGDLEKVRAGHPLSPVLLVRGDASTGRVAQIADGYHRVCASYLTDENTDVTVRIVDLAQPQ